MAAFLDVCRFNPTAGGTTDWTFSSVVTGYLSPAGASAANGRVYKVRSESADLSQWEISEGAHNSGVFARTTVLFNSAGTGTLQGGAGTKINFSAAPQVAVVALKEDLLAADEIGLACGIINGTLVASAAAGTLTVSVKTVAGNDPSILDPVYFYFRNNTLTSGDFSRIAVTAALSVVLGSTKTLGATSATGVRVWITAHNNVGTVQLGAINCSDSTGVFCPAEHVKYATAVPASSSKTFYSTSAIVTAAPWRFLGFCEWTSLTTAGTWVAPDIVQLFGPGIKKPGDVVQSVSKADSTKTTTTSATFVTTGLSTTVTPSSTANLVKATASGTVFNSAAGGEGVTSQFRGSTQIGSSTDIFSASTIMVAPAGMLALDSPNTTASTTYSVQIKALTGTAVWNQNTLPCQLLLEEIMG